VPFLGGVAINNAVIFRPVKIIMNYIQKFGFA